MSEFSKNSAWGQEDQRARESREADKIGFHEEGPLPPSSKIAVQYVGRPNIVEVPKRDLEDIVHGLRQITISLDIEDAQLESDIEDFASRLASYLPG